MTDVPNQPPQAQQPRNPLPPSAPLEPRYEPFAPGSPLAPRPKPTWSFVSGHERASFTIAFLVIAAAAEIACSLEYKLATARRGPEFNLVGNLIGWLAAALVFVSIIAFAAWTHRVYRNLPALGVRRLRFTPAWAVAWMFIPFANLILPYFVFIEIWRGSDPVEKTEAERRKRRVPLLLFGWWIANLLPYVVLVVAIGLFGYWYYQASEASEALYDPAQTASILKSLDQSLAYLNGVVLPLLSAAAAVFGIFIVRRIDVNQQKKFDSLRTN